MRGAEPDFVRPLFRLCAAAVGAVVVGVVGGVLAYWLGYLAIELGLIRANSFVDDDLALKNIGIAYLGALAGVIVGAILGWRVTQRRK